LETLAPYLERAKALAGRHSRSLTTGFVVLLGGFTAAAFGVAPLMPDAAELPRQWVVDTLVPEGMRSQVEALAEQDLELSRSELTRAGDTVDSLLRRLGVVDAQAAAFLRSDPLARRLVDGRAGKLVQVRATAQGTLVDLVARYGAPDGAQRQPQFTRLSVTRHGNAWVSRSEVAPLVAQTRMAGGTIRSTLYAATDEARVPDAVASQLAEIFSADIDFHRELRRGDTFSVLYEALVADGEPVSWAPAVGRVLAAEFVNGGKSHQAIWYSDASGRGAYFGFDGQSKHRSFLASPLEFSRVTSGFAMRLHPLQQHWRAHLGVDYGAPVGTAVRSVGDGVVEFAGVQNGYGNVVQVSHGHERSTLYAHLSRVDVRKGQAVEQGQRIGAVGMTGWTTGPHLHFEFRVNGQHQDPLKVAKAVEPLVVEPGARSVFAELSRSARTQLGVAETLAGGRSLFE
jgi:murein DD-endopeptidase MepM/ murein hydrolase activator NlpD